MFESIDDSGLIATVEEATRAEAASAALRLAAVGELLTRRLPDPHRDDTSMWACDAFDSVAAEVAAATNMSHGRACGQLRIAEILRDRLPRVAALFTRGQLSARVVYAITWRTRLIVDAAVWARLDAALSERARTWGPLADAELTTAVDALIYEYDREAVIQVKQRVRGRDFGIGCREDEEGLTSFYGKMPAADIKLLYKKAAAIARSVCENDPRSAGERRSDALFAMSEGNAFLRCMCGRSDCPVQDRPTSKSSVVIAVIADETAIAAAGKLQEHGESRPEREQLQAEEPSLRDDFGVAVLSDGSTVPTPLLAVMLANGARLRPLRTPCGADPEPRYRPSARLAEFIRARDMTCRFPGCRVPAERCDIDHVVPYPIGPTHASNLVCLCRKHHLLKTFWVGDWALTLASDGAATWTSPTGKRYTTHPGCRSLFPWWNTDTGHLPTSDRIPERSGSGLAMPARSQSRAMGRARRIKTERSQKNSDPPD
ncbi:HNH endonuclease signature motif containing protein [Mycobacterium sp. 1274761.0]|uniref:HNH endonuclease signature motif containing protein n=1 Tax=Mycobacterium sp. 1274761.0 TaxID=1834077 RepID=UPI0018D34F2A|nr:HNH endonuclease signature motif containing protein [Mycobacterium sp. 1274761.0]